MMCAPSFVLLVRLSSAPLRPPRGAEDIPLTPSLCKSIVVPYVDINAKVTNFFPFCTIGISMYQKRILPYIIIPYFLTPSFFPFGAFQTDKSQHTFVPYFFFFFHWARGALPAGATRLGWPNYGVDGRLNKLFSLLARARDQKIEPR